MATEQPVPEVTHAQSNEVSALETHKTFFYETFIQPGGAVWVQGAYKYGGIGLLIYGVCLIPFLIFPGLLVEHSYRFFCYALYASSLLIAWILGVGSWNLKKWAVYGWVGVALAWCIGLVAVPYGYQLWFPALFPLSVAGFGVYYRKDFKKGSWFGVILGTLVVISALVLVAALARPELFHGPTQAERQHALTSFFNPAFLIKSSKGKTDLMELYGYSSQDIISGTVSDEQVLQKISQNPEPFNTLVSELHSSFGGYVYSLLLALLPSDSIGS